MSRVVFTLSAMALACAVAPGSAAAGDNDLVLARLARVITDGSGTPVRTVGLNQEWRSLASELGVVMAPRLSAPSDTLGFGGFQFAFDVARTSITSGASYWRALAGSPDPTGSGGMDHGAAMLPTVGLFVRKGLWLPLPSFELGGGAVHLLDSGLWSGQLYAKFALHEGYHELPIPSVAVRGGVSRLFGEVDLDLTVASVDVSASKHVGVGGTWGIDPYVGWSALIIVPRSEVIDPTPNVDSLEGGNEDDGQLNFVFKDQDDIIRHRFFFGAKLQYHVFQLTLEGALATRGSSLDDRSSTTEACTQASTTEQCDAADRAGRQASFVGSVGMDF
jgi:hypothetical protein